MATTTSTITESEPQLRQVDPEIKVQKDTNNFFEDVHFLGDKEGKVVIRSPPKFDNPQDELKYQKQHLAVAFRVFAKQGFDEGVAGHISLKDPVNHGECRRVTLPHSSMTDLARTLLDKPFEQAFLYDPSIRPCPRE